MSLTCKHLNADSTFLLTFSPKEPLPQPKYEQPPGTFSILIDPWLNGPSTMWHPKFLYSKHTVASCISNLSHIPEPHVVLISQDKPDHCHEPTLRQLDPTSQTTEILASPAAAKKILAMKHFDPSRVHALPSFSDRNPDSVIRFYIPPICPGGLPGEATIAYIPAKLDVSGLHNAIGITYRPPSSTVSRPINFSLPTPPLYSTFDAFRDTPRPQTAPQNFLPTPPDSPDQRTSTMSSSTATASDATSPLTPATSTSTNTTATSHSPSASIASMYSFTACRRPVPEKTISLIYSPHGVPYSTLRPYASSHLVYTAALPLTALLHSFDRVENPWWLGGNVNAGLPGGVDIAQSLMAKCWISAHDEEKENTGLSVKKVVTRKYTATEVREMVAKGKGGTGVAVLDCGEEIKLKA